VISHDVVEHAVRGIARLVGAGGFGHPSCARARRATGERSECGRNRLAACSMMAIPAPPTRCTDRNPCFNPSSRCFVHRFRGVVGGTRGSRAC
jgi:hypothetical protein